MAALAAGVCLYKCAEVCYKVQNNVLRYCRMLEVEAQYAAGFT
jgi:hypothetical protein